MAAIAGRADVLAPRRYVLCPEGSLAPVSGTGRDPLNHDGP